MKQIAPRGVFEACARGLAARIRYSVGGTQAAVDFAQMVVDGWPIEATHAAEVLEAHRLLDRAVIDRGGETRELAISRNLWGGDDAPAWADRIVDECQHRARPVERPEPETITIANAAGETFDVEVEPVAAAAVRADLGWLDDLIARLARLDADTIARITAAIEAARTEAVRLAGVRAGMALKRVPSAMVASLDVSGVDVLSIRRTFDDADPFERWTTARPVLAVLDLAAIEAITEAVDNLERTVRRIIIAALATARDALADGFDDTEDAPASIPADEARDRSTLASAFVAAMFGRWVSRLLDDVDDPAEVLEVAVPSFIAADGLAVAAGAATDGVAIMRGPDGLPVTTDGRPVTGLGARQAIDRIEREVASLNIDGTTTSRNVDDSLARLIDGTATVRIAERHRWHYGDASSRRVPYEPHVRLDRREWIGEDERSAAIGGNYPGDHPGCQCQIITTPIVLLDEQEL